MKKLFTVILLLLSPVLFAETYIHNSLPHLYGNPQVDEKVGTLTYKTTEGKQLTVKLSDVSKTTSERINKVKQNEVVLLDGNICQAFHVAQSGRAEFTCRTGITYKNSVYGKTHMLKKFVKHSSDVVPEVKELNGMRKGEYVKLQVPTGNIDSGEEVRIEAIMANGEVLIRRTGFLRMVLLQAGGAVVRDISIIKANVADICKCN